MVARVPEGRGLSLRSLVSSVTRVAAAAAVSDSIKRVLSKNFCLCTCKLTIPLALPTHDA